MGRRPVTEAEITIAQKLLPRDWTPLRNVVLGVEAYFGHYLDLDLVMINRYVREGVLELMLVRPDGTPRQFSRMECKQRTISAPFHRAEGVGVEPYEDGQYLGRLAESISPATTTSPADQPGDAQPQPQSSPQPPVPKLSGKQWVKAAYDRRPNELLAMGITGASEALAEESKTAPDCAKPLTARYIEKLLRELRTFPKAHRGSSKQRPK